MKIQCKRGKEEQTLEVHLAFTKEELQKLFGPNISISKEALDETFRMD